MTPEPPRTVVMLGVPRTGKTTYLGTLWQMIDDPSVEYVREIDLRGDRAYLQELAAHIMRCEEPPRTPLSSDDGLSLTLALADFGVAQLQIPDLSGELTDTVVYGRYWSPALHAVLPSADGVLVFLHPDHLLFPRPISLLEDLVPADEPLGSPGDVPFAPEGICTAAVYVDLLENLQHVLSLRPIRLSVVVSAWDLVADHSPATWLAERLPLLDQYLAARADVFQLRLFGVSAQGGRVEDRDSLLIRGNLSQRAYVKDQRGQPVRFTAPVAWALWGVS